MSPNIEINNPNAWIGNNPWGLHMGRMIVGSKYYSGPRSPGVTDTVAENQYWFRRYRLEAISQLEEMLEDRMNTATFKRIIQPSLTLYYYKNDLEQDKTVKVSAILEMNRALSTPDSLKDAIPIPNSGDHVMGSYIVSKDLESVSREMRKFAVEKLRMKPINE
jgi:hypothetical protein